LSHVNPLSAPVTGIPNLFIFLGIAFTSTTSTPSIIFEAYWSFFTSSFFSFKISPFLILSIKTFPGEGSWRFSMVFSLSGTGSLSPESWLVPKLFLALLVF
jgi:hypothetical protein